MKKARVYMILFVILCLPSPAGATSDPTFGAQLQLTHYDDGDDRQDVLITNFTDDNLYYEGTASQSCVNIIPWSTDGFPDSGIMAAIGPSCECQASLSTLQWTNTKEDDPYLAMNYSIGGYLFTLMVFPQHQHSLFTDLMFAWHVINSVRLVAEIAVGDEEAGAKLLWNIERAIHEGNKMDNEPNLSWSGVSASAAENMWYPATDLTYSILYQKLGGEYVFGKAANDHIAFDVDGEYVIQLATVNTTYDDYTGNTQLTVNIYTRDQWDSNVYPYGHLQWWNSPVLLSGGYSPAGAISSYGGYKNAIDCYVHSDDVYMTLSNYNPSDGNSTFPIWTRKIADDATHPSISSLNKYIVEIHQGSGHKDSQLYCWLATLNEDATDIAWTYTGDSFYDHGNWVDVAMYDDLHFLAFFEDTNDSYAYYLSYAVGTIDADRNSVNIDVTTKYDSGLWPSVAARGDHFVTVHCSQNTTDEIWYQAGTIEAGYILDFETKDKLPDNCRGYYPSVAMTDDGIVIVAFKNTAGALSYVIGQMDFSGTCSIAWEDPISDIPTGYYYPSVDITDDGYAFAVATDGDGDYVYYQLGWYIEE